ncbi:MAG: hypothetical protein OEW91_09775 [Acidimicrobiia bacterium]|nr:hypothetical protein [Acidimicrobiia bacterium]
MSTAAATSARLDQLVAGVLASTLDDAELEIRMPALEAPVDDVWTEALLTELVRARFDDGAETLAVRLRLSTDHIELAVWDDAPHASVRQVVNLLARKISATVTLKTKGPGDVTTTLSIPI